MSPAAYNRTAPSKATSSKIASSKTASVKTASAKTVPSELEKPETSRVADKSVTVQNSTSKCQTDDRQTSDDPTQELSQAKSHELSLELLTFLGEFSDDDGEVIDPETLDPIASDGSDQQNNSNQAIQQDISKQRVSQPAQSHHGRPSSEPQTNGTDIRQSNTQAEAEPLVKSQPDKPINVNDTYTSADKTIDTNEHTNRNDNSTNCHSNTVKQTARSVKETINDV